MQLRCLNKFFKNLIFDPHFVDLHLNKSARNSQQLALTCINVVDHTSPMETLSIPHLLQNKFPIFHQHTDPDRLLNDGSHVLQRSRMQRQFVVGSCNGLICLYVISYPFKNQWICFWNPAMRTKSKFFDCCRIATPYFTYSFGYDNSTRTYKVVTFYRDWKVEPGCSPKGLLKVFSLGSDDDNSCWRDIQCSFPVIPQYGFPNCSHNNKGVYLNSTINWIVIRDYNNMNSINTVDQYAILSLDLSTEKCTQLLLPQRFDEVPSHRPKLVVLMGCLCFCHDIGKTHFVIWQMKNFRVQESWNQLFQISYQEKFFGWLNLLPLYLSENHDTLILANAEDYEAFIYNHRYNRVEKIGKNKIDKIEITNNIMWSRANDYVESLVSIH